MTRFFYTDTQNFPAIGFNQSDQRSNLRERGYQLLNLALEKLQLPVGQNIKFNPFGKPYFDNHMIQFNLSHSGNIIVCGLSDRAIGVDVQQYYSLKEICTHFFWNRNDITQFNANNFHEIIDSWSAKEAVSKLIGLGLGYPFKEIWLDCVNPFRHTAYVQGKKADLSRIHIHPEYSCWISQYAIPAKIVPEFILLPDRNDFHY